MCVFQVGGCRHSALYIGHNKNEYEQLTRPEQIMAEEISDIRIPPDYQPPTDVIVLGLVGAFYSFAPHALHTLLSPERMFIGRTFPHAAHTLMGFMAIFTALVRFNRYMSQ